MLRGGLQSRARVKVPVHCLDLPRRHFCKRSCFLCGLSRRKVQCCIRGHQPDHVYGLRCLSIQRCRCFKLLLLSVVVPCGDVSYPSRLLLVLSRGLLQRRGWRSHVRAHVFNVPCGEVRVTACFLFPLSIRHVSAKRWPALVHNVPRGKVLWRMHHLCMRLVCRRLVLFSGRQLVHLLSPPQHLAARFFSLQPMRSRLQWHQRPPWSVGAVHQLHRLRPGLLQLLPFTQHNLMCALSCGHRVPLARQHFPRRLHPLPSRGVLHGG